MGALAFRRSVHASLWGTESWEISALASDPSVIVGGALDGRTLRETCPDFPLLFKVIDAHTRLSVQVHPNELTCKRTGGAPKSEMWCALSDGPIYAGLRPGVTAAELATAIGANRVESLLVRHEAKAGDVFFIPGGLVHAIGDGVRLYEVQQSSDTTFRLYDWQRRGADGRPRELHVEQGLQAADCSLPPPTPCRALQTRYFDFSQVTLEGTSELAAGAGEWLAVFVARGEIVIDGAAVEAGASRLLLPGDACRVAATRARVFLTRFRQGD